MKVLCYLFLLVSSLFGQEVYFIAYNPAPAEHFKVFENVLRKEGLTVFFQKTNLNNEEEIVRECAKATCIITEGGHPFFASLQHRLAAAYPHVKRYLYYENTESYVPGGYSAAIAQVMEEPLTGVLFANAVLAEVFHTPLKKKGIGYFPMEEVEILKELRLKQEVLKTKHSLEGKTLLVYLGGANRFFFDESFPHFVQTLALSKQENVILLYQRHPRAEEESSLDLVCLKKFASLLEAKKIEVKISTLPLFEAIGAADCVLYAQTTVAPKCALAHIPIIQVAKKPYEDVLLKSQAIESVATPDALDEALKKISEPKEEGILQAIGYQADWKNHLRTIIEEDDV